MSTEHATETLDLNTKDDPVIGVVCDHCQAQYAVSIHCFADSYRHRFACASCGEAWVEYLEDDMYAHVQQLVAEVSTLEEVQPETQSGSSNEDDDDVVSMMYLDGLLSSDDQMESAEDTEDDPSVDLDALEDEEDDPQEQEEEQDFESLKADDDVLKDILEDILAADSEEAEEAEEVAEPKKEGMPIRSLAEENPGLPSFDRPSLDEHGDALDLSFNDAQDNDMPEKKSLAQKFGPSAWGDFRLWPLTLGVMLIAFLFVGTGGYFYLNRYEIINNNPSAVGAYQFMGIKISPVEGLAVEIDDITRKSVVIAGEETQFEFEIVSKVRNISDTERRLPFLRVHLQDENSRIINYWDVNLTGRVLDPGAEMDLNIPYPAQFVGDISVESIELRLLSRQEREILGINNAIETLELSG